MEIIKTASGKGKIVVSASEWTMIGWKQGWITTANATAEQRKIIAFFTGENEFDKGTGAPPVWDKQKDNGSAWKHDSITDPNAHYQIVKDSYEKGETGQAMPPDEYFSRVKGSGAASGGWQFFGDKNQTGWLTARDCAEDAGDWAGVMKLTGSAGSKEGMSAGMAKLLGSGAPVWGAMTPDLWTTAMKLSRGQLKSLPAQQLKILINYAPKNIWGYSAPQGNSIKDDGMISIYNPGVGKTTDKKFLCNDAFIAFLNNYAKKKMSGMGGQKGQMGGQKGYGY